MVGPSQNSVSLSLSVGHCLLCTYNHFTKTIWMLLSSHDAGEVLQFHAGLVISSGFLTLYLPQQLSFPKIFVITVVLVVGSVSNYISHLMALSIWGDWSGRKVFLHLWASLLLVMAFDGICYIPHQPCQRWVSFVGVFFYVGICSLTYHNVAKVHSCPMFARNLY